MALLSLFLMLFLTVGASFGQCPPPEDILPCTCTVNNKVWLTFNLKVLCWKMDDVDAVRWALQSVRGIQRVSVEFRDSRLGSVPSDLFKGLHVTHLFFYRCVLKRIGDVRRSALEGLENIVEELKVVSSFSADNPIRFLNVSRLSKLQYLEIRRNNMEELDNEWFAEGPANLKAVYFWNNEITKLGDRAFVSLINMDKLWMSDNKIKSVERSMFPSPAAHLFVINLSGNKLTSLPFDLFSDMPNLIHVYLENNSIRRILETAWKPVWSRLTHVYLEGNPLECDAWIEWIFKEKRLKVLTGKCVSPDERKGVDIMKIIDDNQKDT